MKITPVLRGISATACLVAMAGCAQDRMDMGHGMSGQGMGPGSGMGMMGGGQAGADPASTPGWSLMTPEERRAHWDRIRSAATPEECERYMEEHHQQMVERAKARGETLPPRPRPGPCVAMKRGAPGSPQ